MKIEAGRLVVAQLKQEGVDVLFSLNGGHIALIYDACLDFGVQIVDVRHAAPELPPRPGTA